ncbi:hypothetical protein ACFV1C_00370 [Streptomyces sp. NPDC059605]|uniref:hypothetical protein n=1 Tax=Streptomyces sp. NPDC059605 TaxID=3346882 RepID=UPI0036AD70D6
MNAPMTPDAAKARLQQYGERTSTWSTATYNDGTEKALHEIALTLATEVTRLKQSAALAEEDYQRIVRGACQVESQLRARVAELEAATYIAPSPSCTRCYGADAVRFMANGGTTAPCLTCGPSQVEQLHARVAELETLELGAADDRVSATCADSDHPTWLRAADDTRGCPWCRIAELEAASPWERAVAGLNALVDADVIFHVEPDGHISAPFSDEHIEWDLKARRWVLTHDDEEEEPVRPCGCPARFDRHADGCPKTPSMTADEWNRLYPVGTPVLAYPLTRDDEPLDTATRTPAWTLGHGEPVVSVEGYAGGICLTHVDPIGGAS